MADLLGIDRRKNKENPDYLALKKGVYPSNVPIRVKQLIGQFRKNNGEISQSYDRSKYIFMLNAPFNVSARCCSIMKKSPAHIYGRVTGRKPFIGTTCEESYLRQSQWIRNGCNAYEGKYPSSKPLSFWTEQDILRYIKNKGLKIASVYGDVVVDYEAEDQLEGQVDLCDLGMIADDRKLKTTGVNRTGCAFCLYGAHLEKSPNRLERMKVTHPAIYDYIMRPEEKGGLGFKRVIDWIADNSDIKIKY